MNQQTQMLYQFLLYSLFTFSVVAAPPVNQELIELAQLMDGSKSSSPYFPDVDTQQLKSIRFVSPTFISDLSVTESMIDSSDYIIERVTYNFAGNTHSEMIKLSKEDFYARVQLVAKSLKENGQVRHMELVFRSIQQRKTSKE